MIVFPRNPSGILLLHEVKLIIIHTILESRDITLSL